MERASMTPANRDRLSLAVVRRSYRGQKRQRAYDRTWANYHPRFR